jgi:hypothetical protein
MKVNSIAHLVQLIDEGHSEFFILLKGSLRSSKNISLVRRKGRLTPVFLVYNYIDDSECEYTPSALKASIIGEALRLGSLYLDD